MSLSWFLSVSAVAHACVGSITNIAHGAVDQLEMYPGEPIGDPRIMLSEIRQASYDHCPITHSALLCRFPILLSGLFLVTCLDIIALEAAFALIFSGFFFLYLPVR